MSWSMPCGGKSSAVSGAFDRGMGGGLHGHTKKRIAGSDRRQQQRQQHPQHAFTAAGSLSPTSPLYSPANGGSGGGDSYSSGYLDDDGNGGDSSPGTHEFMRRSYANSSLASSPPVVVRSKVKYARYRRKMSPLEVARKASSLRRKQKNSSARPEM